MARVKKEWRGGDVLTADDLNNMFATKLDINNEEKILGEDIKLSTNKDFYIASNNATLSTTNDFYIKSNNINITTTNEFRVKSKNVDISTVGEDIVVRANNFDIDPDTCRIYTPEIDFDSEYYISSSCASSGNNNSYQSYIHPEIIKDQDELTAGYKLNLVVGPNKLSKPKESYSYITLSTGYEQGDNYIIIHAPDNIYISTNGKAINATVTNACGLVGNYINEDFSLEKVPQNKFNDLKFYTANSNNISVENSIRNKIIGIPIYNNKEFQFNIMPSVNGSGQITVDEEYNLITIIDKNILFGTEGKYANWNSNTIIYFNINLNLIIRSGHITQEYNVQNQKSYSNINIDKFINFNIINDKKILIDTIKVTYGSGDFAYIKFYLNITDNNGIIIMQPTGAEVTSIKIKEGSYIQMYIHSMLTSII